MRKTYTVKQVAQSLGFSTNTVYKYLDEGKIKATRLGKEGRFRISESEILRLMGSKGAPIQAPVEQISATPEAEKQEILDSISPDRISLAFVDVINPKLFDWFVAMMGIFLGVSYLLFPLYMQNIVFKPYSMIVSVSQVLMIVLGIGLICADIFKTKKSYVSIILHLSLGVVFALMGYVFYKTGNFLSMSGLLGISFITIFSVFIKISEIFRFTMLVLFLTSVTGFLYLDNPSLLTISTLTSWVQTHRFIFILSWFFMIIQLFAVSILARTAGGIFTFIFGLQIAFGAFLYSALNVANFSWDQAIYALVLGGFGLLLPFAKKFEEFTNLSKKELIFSFCWLGIVILIGIGLVFYIQLSFKNLVFQENRKSLGVGKAVVEDFMENTFKSVENFAQDQRIIASMSAKELKKEELVSLVKDLYANSTTLKRIFILSAKGKGVEIYPLEDGVIDVDFSDKDYYREIVEGKKRLTVSNDTKLIVTAPIISTRGEVIGVLGASVDLLKLESQLNRAELGQGSYFVIADNKGQIIIHPVAGQLYEETTNQALKLVAQGKTGEAEGYSQDGELSLQNYSSISKFGLGWGIVIKQPLTDVSRQNSSTAFIIFMITLFSGVGSLLMLVNYRRGRSVFG